MIVYGDCGTGTVKCALVRNSYKYPYDSTRTSPLIVPFTMRQGAFKKTLDNDTKRP
jgi:hypothetical protein